MVREWDPSTAPESEVTALVDLLNAVVAVDTPADPLWRYEGFRDYLTHTMPGERRVTWVVPASGEDHLVGYASLLLMDDIGVLELNVHPAARRHRVGAALLTAVARRAHDEGLPSLGVEAIGDTPAVAFYEALSFRWAFAEMRNVLDLSTVDWFRIGETARSIGSGYRIEFHPGGPPEEIYPAYARAKESVREGAGDLDLRPSSYDPERLRASIATLHARGLKPYIVVAVHEPTDAVAGLTEVVVPRQRPTRADQYDTIVVPEHRGYGIGRAIKARMLFELRSSEPQLLEVQTWHATENEPLLKVNAELGFLPDREWREYEADVTDVLRRLRPAAA